MLVCRLRLKHERSDPRVFLILASYTWWLHMLAPPDLSLWHVFNEDRRYLKLQMSLWERYQGC